VNKGGAFGTQDFCWRNSPRDLKNMFCLVDAYIRSWFLLSRIPEAPASGNGQAFVRAAITLAVCVGLSVKMQPEDFHSQSCKPDKLLIISN
jgi:hypothetical protein